MSRRNHNIIGQLMGGEFIPPRANLRYEYLAGSLLDSSANSNDLTNFGTTLTDDQFSVPNSARLFDGTAKLEVANDASLQMTDVISIVQGFEVASFPACLIHKGGAVDFNNILDNYRVIIGGGGEIVFYYANANVSNLRQFILDDYTVSVDTFTFIILTFQWPDLSSITIDVNGTVYDSTNGTWTTGDGSPISDLQVQTENHPLRFGVRQYFTGPIQYQTGVQYNRWLYNSILSPSIRQQFWNSENPA